MIDHAGQRRAATGRQAEKNGSNSRLVAFGSVAGVSSMRAKQSILGLVYTGREVRRPPLVGMQFLHESTVSPADFVPSRPRLQAKDLIGFLVRHFAARRRAALPPCRISLRVLTPGGKAAVQIRFK